MIISKIQGEGFWYFNMHAEEVVTANFINDNNSGISGDRLQIITLQRVVDFLKHPDNKLKNVVLDFEFLNACQQNINKLIFELKGDGFNILFLQIKKSICEDMALTSILNSKNSLNKVGDFTKYYFFEDSSNPFTLLNINANALFKEAFKQKIKPLIAAHNEPHTSSFVYLTSYVDVKKFLSHEKDFMLFSIYRLAIKIRNEWKIEIDEDPILVCQSMNSAFIVSLLSTMLQLDILILDKIGPINTLYNRLDRNILDNRKYIVVSDLVCLGTEVKIVKNLIEFIGGKYLGNVSLIKTETLKKADIKSGAATKAIFSINRTNNKELGYNITTDLEPI